VAFFGTGVMKGWIVGQRLLLSGLETLAIGGAAASAAYLIGVLLRNVAAGA
jgi:VIT1/CCC1 family predicted Fe2+/Mn2+ transporter